MPAPPEYSDDAAMVFAVALLSPYVIVAGLWLANRVRKHYFGRPVYPAPIDAKQARVIEREKAEHGALKRLFTTGFTVNLVLVLLASYALVNLTSAMSHQSEVAEYDPFQILQIDRGASDSEIKSSYRKLSLLYHPDKNPGNEEAEKMFMAVSKAYETLTDAAARENWELYGNPDGRQSLAVSIGLPKVLLQQDTKTTVVLIYVFFLVICVPALVFCCRRTEAKVTLNEQSIHTLFRLQSLAPQLKDYIELMSHLPDLYMMSVKLKIDNKDPAFTELDEALNINVRSAFDPSKSLKGGPAYPVFVALTAFFNRHERLPRPLIAIQEEFIKYSDVICQTLLGLAGQARPPFFMNEKGKKMPLVYDPSFALRNAIEFQTRIRQRLWTNSSSLLQIPNFTEEMANYCKVGKGGSGAAVDRRKSGANTTAPGRLMSLKDYIRQDRAALKGLKDLTPQQHHEVLAFLDICPNLHVEAHVNVAQPHPEFTKMEFDDENASGSDSDTETDKEGKITKVNTDESEAEAAKTAEVQSGFRERDVVTLTVIATHENLPADQDELPPVYTPYQDKLQREEWFVFLVNENDQVVQIGQFPNPLKRTMKLEMKFQAPRIRKGKPYHFHVEVISGNYVDLSFSAPVMFEVTEAFPEESMRPQVIAPPKAKGDGDSSDDSSDEDVGAGTGMSHHGHSHGGPGDHGHSHGGEIGGDDSDDGMPDLIPAPDDNTAGLSAAQLRKRQKRLESKQKKTASAAAGAAVSKANDAKVSEDGEGAADGETAEVEGSGKPHDD